MTARAPHAQALAPYVGGLWYGGGGGGGREHVLPTGRMHVAIRLDGPPLRLYAGRGDRVGTTVDTAVACGARSRYYAKRVEPCRTVGARLLPGAARALFGVSAAALSERHVPLRSLWGDAAVDALQARLAAASTPAGCLDALEGALLAQLRPADPLPPAVVAAIAALDQGQDLRALLDMAGCSHRHFIACFRDATGLAPKRYARLRRFRRVLADMAGGAEAGVALALAHGYCDQPHLARDFRQFAGVPARTYQHGRRHPRHVRIED